jgi:hypothetical protein
MPDTWYQQSRKSTGWRFDLQRLKSVLLDAKTTRQALNPRALVNLSNWAMAQALLLIDAARQTRMLSEWPEK